MVFGTVCHSNKQAITQCLLVEILSQWLKELKTVIQCLGIKPKAINT